MSETAHARIALGVALLERSPFALGAASFLVGALHTQILREEAALLEVHGERYLRYLDATPRYFRFRQARIED